MIHWISNSKWYLVCIHMGRIEWNSLLVIWFEFRQSWNENWSIHTHILNVKLIYGKVSLSNVFGSHMYTNVFHMCRYLSDAIHHDVQCEYGHSSSRRKELLRIWLIFLFCSTTANWRATGVDDTTSVEPKVTRTWHRGMEVGTTKKQQEMWYVRQSFDRTESECKTSHRFFCAWWIERGWSRRSDRRRDDRKWARRTRKRGKW